MNRRSQYLDATLLLEQLAEEPEAIVEIVPPDELGTVVSALHSLSEDSRDIVDEDGLLDFSQAVYDVFAKNPALRQALIPETSEAQTMRKVSVQTHQDLLERNENAQTKVAQIRNRVIECREKLESALQDSKDIEDGEDKQSKHG